jgi:hypothetical protein
MIITKPCPSKAKAILLADLHLHNKPDWRFIWNNDFIEELLAPLSACTRSCSDLILMGDVFEVRNNVDSRVINQFIGFVGSMIVSYQEEPH